jgi:sodium/proline symporter
MVQQLFTPFFAGLVLCAIIAAGLTTIDTQILVTASVFATDIYKQCINPRATSDQVVRMSRWGIILIPSISYLIASTRMSSVFGLVEFAWHGLGSSFGPVLLMALYSKQITKHGALAGMITGAIIAALWPLTGISIPPMIPAFGINLCVIIFVSRFTQ